MSIELRQLKDAVTGQPFVPVTHWDAISNKPNIDGSLNSINASLNALDTSVKALDSYTETDPTVPAWAKAANKPSYTASEVGALPSSTHIPSTVAELTDSSNYVTETQLSTALSAKQDTLTAGDNIEISNDGTISATDTTYVASDFDIKDLADSTGLREEWSSKQDALVEVVETGFYVVDENMNIGFYVDSSGAHSINLVEYQSVN